MGQALGRAINVTEYVFPVLAPTYDESHELLVKFGSEADIDVPALLLAPAVEDKSQLGSLVTICAIYFHPNAADIGDCLNEIEMIRDGAFDGDAVVLAPEYPGYGLLIEYTPTVAGIDRVAMAAWKFCREGLGFPPERIVLWGRSIGTGPASALARSVTISPEQTLVRSQPAPDPLGALVLVAPFISIVEVAKAHTNTFASSLMSPMWEVCNLVSDQCLTNVPLCILHPADDEVIPPSHGSTVLENAASQHRLAIWLRGASHNFNLQEEHLERVGDFLGKHFGLSSRLDGEDFTGGIVLRGEGARPPNPIETGDPDEDDRQDIIGRLVWWSLSGRADLLHNQ